MKVAFVILHYLTINETIECITSISENLMSGDNEIFIIVVDNNSPNNSYEVLKNKYEYDNDIIIIHNDTNMGYAKGNNTGFLYAKTVLNADYIVLLNNDTVIRQGNWIDQIQILYQRYRFAVLGPNIVTASGKHQNPVPETKWSVGLLRRKRLRKRLKWLLIFLGLDSALAIRNKRMADGMFIEDEKIDVELHGSCLVFSREYIDLFDGLYDKTFMYMEEDILLLILRERGLKTLYSPSLSVYHKEDVATNASIKSSRKRKLMKCREWIKSSYIYEELYRQTIHGDRN